ncbi:hypothetical protein [Streptomyces boncukensis]|uniref:Uncharacterized protein n=1 Tax=Streptomyces boncukensis TaxID=2711219 RepID=A0A6G4WX73_9ACTN|nr:hypothetical protein [Streptomyces boncukensis]NGO69230.1 hypothetical protein [Streptomyces boncukensis]
MSFEEEWAQHKAAVAPRQPPAMQLNEAGDGPPAPWGTGGSGNSDLASVPAEKKKAAKCLEEEVLPDTATAGKHAGGATQSVTGSAPAGRVDVVPFGGPGELDKWEVRTGLNTATRQWGKQVNNLLARLKGEMEALRSASTLYLGSDLGTGSRIRSLIPPGAPGSGTTSDTPSLIRDPEAHAPVKPPMAPDN